jgi:simple sugar transport system substrate-binding protein
MSITRRGLGKLAAGLLGATALMALPALAQDRPAPFDNPGEVDIALVRYLSTGDFFQAYLSGVEEQAQALGVNLRVFDSRQDAALQADMVDQAIALGVDGIVIQHGLTESMREAAQRAVDAGIAVVAFDVNVENEEIPQIEQSDRDLARLALEQAIEDNGEEFVVGYVYVPGIAPLDRRDETWQEFKERYPGIQEVARFGTLDNPIANSNANQARSVLAANPNITVMFAPYDEFAKGVKIAVDEAGLSDQVKIYSADISTADIAAMREPGSAWVATAATNPAVVGQVSVRALAMLLAGEDPGDQVIVPPTLITQDMLNELDITNMEELAERLPQFAHADVAAPDWMPLPQSASAAAEAVAAGEGTDAGENGEADAEGEAAAQ